MLTEGSVLYLGASAGANKLWLCRQVIIQRSPGVFSAVFLIHTCQVPCSWEQILHWASRDITGCMDRLEICYHSVKASSVKASNETRRTNQSI